MNELNLDLESIQRANNSSLFDAGSSLAKEAQRVYESNLTVFAPRESWSEEQKEFAMQRAQQWKELVENAYNDIIRRRASWMPWTVCGRANYDWKRNNQRADAQVNASNDWGEKMQRFIEDTKKRIAELRPAADQIEAYRSGKNEAPIKCDDPLAVQKLEARIEYLKEHHAQTLALNRYYRKHGTMVGAPGITEETARHIDEQFKDQPKCFQVVGFPTNEAADIRRAQKRLEEIKRIRSTEPTKAQPDIEGAGYRVEENIQDCRLRIIFDEKPDSDKIALLKSHGFRWSPRAGAWQRQLTENARAAAKIICAKF